MATNYSLISFQGRTGATVTMTIASPCVVSLTAHGAVDGTAVVFTTSGSLPTGVTSGTTYYARVTGVTTPADNLQLYDTFAHAMATGSTTGRVNTSGSQSGTHTVWGSLWYNLPTGANGTGKTRYGVAGSERVFNGLVAWRTNRVTTSPPPVTDLEVCELGSAFRDKFSSVFSMTVQAASILITSFVNGTRSQAWHGGLISSAGIPHGYIFDYTGAGDTGVAFDGFRHTIDGFTVGTAASSKYLIRLYSTNVYSTVKNCIVYGYGGSSGNLLIYDNNANTYNLTNNIIYGGAYGLYTGGYYQVGSVIANNLVTLCTNGMHDAGGTGGNGYGWWQNNISVGNTTANWSTYLSTNWYSGSNNVGEATKGTPWYKTTNTGITMATTDFTDHANYDFTPKLLTSPQVEAGVTVVGMDAYDIKDAERPNYVGATSGTTVTAGSFIVGYAYTIVSVGSTSFTSIGASANTVGVSFRATGVGTGTGTATCIEVWDCGSYEFDHGFTRPLVRNLNLTGMIDGSQIVVYTDGTQTSLSPTPYVLSGATSWSNDFGSNMTVSITVMKAGYDPVRLTGNVLNSVDTNITIQQTAARGYIAGNPASLTFGTNVTVNATGTTINYLTLSKACTTEQWYSFLIDCWIAAATNTALKNVQFPILTFGPNSYTLVSGIEFHNGTYGATDIAYLTGGGLRYTSDSAGLTTTATWSAIQTLNTDASLYVRYRQQVAGSVTTLGSPGPMNRLLQVYGNASHGNFDYTGYLDLKAPLPGWTNPKFDVYANYGTLQDEFYVAALAPVQQWPCTNADIDAAHLVLDNTAKTYVVSASHTMQEAYQRAQWWSCQDAQWNADTPMTSLDGNTFTLYTGWTLSGTAFLSAGTISGGTAVIGTGTQAVGFNGTALTLGAEGTYTFTMSGSLTATVTPTADNVHYVFASGSFTGTLTVHNANAHPIVVEVPTGTTTSSTGNTGGAITFVAPVTYQSVTVTGFTAGSRLQIYDTTSSTELFNGTSSSGNTIISGSTCTWTDNVAASATRAIRLRVAYQSGVTAKEFIDVNIGTCATSGSGKDLSYLVNQSADYTYNLNAIDGSAVTGITVTAGPIKVSFNLAGGVATNATIYAYQVYWQFTATGIANETSFISSTDPANYIYTDAVWKNTNASVPLSITGGWARDSVTGETVTLFDETGYPIFAAADVSLLVTTGSGPLTSGQAAELSAAASSSAVAAAGVSTIPGAVLTAAASAPIASEIKKVNGYTISGAGTENNPWGP